MHFCVCECTKAWKVAPFTWPHVISEAMCQLTEGTHAPLYSGLSSGPTLCLFFLQWTGSSVYNSHPKPLWNILPATASRHAKAALTSPNTPFCSICRISPYVFSYKAVSSGDKRSYELTRSTCDFSNSYVPNSSECDSFYLMELEGAAKGDGFFQVCYYLYKLKVKNSYILKHYADLYLWGRDLRSC